MNCIQSISPAEDYFNGFVLGVNKDKNGTQYNMEDFGSIRWQLVLSLFGKVSNSYTEPRSIRSGAVTEPCSFEDQILK